MVDSESSIVPKVLLIVSHERSGSHLLQDVLSSGGFFLTLDEVCNHSSAPHSSVKWHNFERQLSEEKKYRRNWQGRLDIVIEYLDFISSISNGNTLIIDVKYGHLQNFEPEWSDLREPPMLFYAAKIHKYTKIVHLYRKNTIEAVCSAELAETTGTWNSYFEQDIGKLKISVDVGGVIFKASVLKRMQEIYSYHLRDVDHAELIYEADLQGGVLTERALRALSRYIGVDIKSVESKTRKISPKLNVLISNYKELNASARESGLGWMLDD